jgi:hypothetical protein
MKRLLIAVLIAIATIGSVQAYDLPVVNLGATSFLDGAPPAGPGFYFAEYLQYYHTKRFEDGPPTANLDVYASLSQLLYQSNQKVLFGGKWGMDVILPVIDFDLDANGAPLTANSAGIGDVLVGPYLQWDPIMGKNGPVFMHRIELQFITPTGRYNQNDALNPGSHFLSFDPYWSATWLPTPKCEVSWRVHYLWNDSNDDTNTQAGQAVHLNLATSYDLIPHKLRAGVNSYYLKQTTDSKGTGGSGREQVIGVGPGLLYSFSQNDHLFANVYFEMCAENRTEGQRYNLRWVHHF